MRRMSSQIRLRFASPTLQSVPTIMCSILTRRTECSQSTNANSSGPLNHRKKPNGSRKVISAVRKSISITVCGIRPLIARYPYQLELLQTVPGFSGNIMTAIALISEIGADMSVFPSAKHLVSWAGCCPRNDQSSKKVKSTRISRAGVYLKPLLVQVANAVIKSDKCPECKERYRRIKARRGHKKAIIAVCRMLLTAIWNILSKLEPYSAAGYLEDKLTDHSVVISKAQGLELLRKRGYISRDEVDPAPA